MPLQLKAFETLLVLVRNGEQVVLKEELMKAVWPDTFVEEGNLTQSIFVLRKTLGAMNGEQKYIETIPGRGYRLAVKVRTVTDEASPAQTNVADSPAPIEKGEFAVGMAFGYRRRRGSRDRWWFVLAIPSRAEEAHGKRYDRHCRFLRTPQGIRCLTALCGKGFPRSLSSPLL